MDQILSPAHDHNSQQPKSSRARNSPSAQDGIPNLLKLFASDNAIERNRAIRAAGFLGPEAREAVPNLFTLLSSPSKCTRDDARATLLKIGNEAVSEFLKWIELEEPSLIVRQSRKAFFEIDSNTPGALPILLDALKSENDETRRMVVFSLGRLSNDASVVVPALIGALSDSSLAVQNTAVVALAKFGPASCEAVPILIERMAFSGHGKREIAKALEKIEIVVGTLEAIGPNARDAVKPLVKLMIAHPSLTRSIAYCLSEIGPDAHEAVPALLDVIERNSDRYVLYPVVRALGNIKAHPAEVVPALVALLKEEKEESAVLDALKKFGPEAHIALPLLIDSLVNRLSTENFRYFTNVSESLIHAIWHIGSSHEVAPVLVTALKSRNEEFRKTAAIVLGDCGREALDIVVPPLQIACEDEVYKVRGEAKKALEKLEVFIQAEKANKILESSRVGSKKPQTDWGTWAADWL